MSKQAIRKISEKIVIIIMTLISINALATLLKQFIKLSTSHFINAIAITGMASCGVVSFILMELGEKEDTKRKSEGKA